MENVMSYLPKEPPFLGVKEIMKIMNCGSTKAYEYIRAIKSVSDAGKTAGRVLVRDFNAWAYGTTDTKQVCVEDIKKDIKKELLQRLENW